MESRPNIVLITISDAGKHIGCYGNCSVETENIDEIAEKGVRFENCFATAPQCSPSRASLMTGRYPQSNGVMGLVHSPFDWSFSEGEEHICSILSKEGYHTGIIGLQHATSDENQIGFQERVSLSNLEEEASDRGGPLCGSIAKRVDKFLRNYSGNSPFYLNINFERAHREGSGFIIHDESNIPDPSKVNVPEYLPDEKGVREEIAEMEGSTIEADYAIGRIRRSLEGTGYSDNTLLIVTTDHGIPFPKAKGTLYDPGVEVFLIMSWPEMIPEGSVYNELISNVDILPTVLDMVDCPVPDFVQGRSFLPLLKNSEYSKRNQVFLQKTFHEYYEPLRAVRTEKFKLIYKFEKTPGFEVPTDVRNGKSYQLMEKDLLRESDLRVEMYDLLSDPIETESIFTNEKFSSMREDLSKKLLGWMEDIEDPLLDGPISSPYYHKSLKHLLDEKRK